MKKILIYLPLSFLISVLLGSASSFSTTRGITVITVEGQQLDIYEDYHALVVGISTYEHWPNLPNAVNDAKEIAANLRELGFKVKLVLDPTFAQMRTVLSNMVYDMGGEKNRAILFYYAGHGETETLADKTKMGYIIPKDCPLLARDPKGFTNHAISMRDIESVSMRIKSRHVIMLFDSCFSGALFALVRAVPHDITEKSALPVRQFITAGREDEQVPDKSIFKRCLLIGLDGDADLTGDGYITGTELGMYLSDKVVNYTHRRQHPQYGKINNPDLDRGDFIFVPLRVRQKQLAEAKKAQEEKESLAEKERLSMKGIEEAKIRQLEAERKAALEKAEKEAAEKKALEEELKRLKTEKRLREESAKKKELEEELKRLKAAQAREQHEKKVEAKQKRDPEKRALEGDSKKLDASAEKRPKLASLPVAARSLKDALKSGKTPFFVDDFEDEDLWSANRYFQWKTRFKNDAKIGIVVDDTQGADGSSCSMKIEYELGQKSGVFVVSSRKHEFPNKTVQGVMIDKSLTLDLSRFRSVVFYLKGKKADSFFSKPNKIFFLLSCYDDDALLKSGRRTWVTYYQKAVIRPDKMWKRIEIPFDDLVPSAWTINNVNYYSDKPDLQNVIGSLFMIGSWDSMGGFPGSNTVWIDEIRFE